MTLASVSAHNIQLLQSGQSAHRMVTVVNTQKKKWLKISLSEQRDFGMPANLIKNRVFSRPPYMHSLKQARKFQLSRFLE